MNMYSFHQIPPSHARSSLLKTAMSQRPTKTHMKCETEISRAKHARYPSSCKYKQSVKKGHGWNLML